MRNEIQLLIDDPDPEREGFSGAADLDSPPSNPNLASVLAIGAAQDFHQRRLAGPVLAEQHVNTARLQRQVDAIERDHAWERLPDAAHLQNGRVVGHGIGISSGEPPARMEANPCHFRIEGPGRKRSSSMNTLLIRVTRTGPGGA